MYSLLSEPMILLFNDIGFKSLAVKQKFYVHELLLDVEPPIPGFVQFETSCTRNITVLFASVFDGSGCLT